MALTAEQSKQLKDFFPVQSHEFLQGNTYLSEEAITNRLDDVDPSWEFHRLGDFAYRDNSIIATFRLTVSGVSRDGIGMWDLTIKKKDGNLMPAVDPEKSVSTDALKRAARLFGIGRYILEMKGVNDYNSLKNWLAQQRKINTSTGEMPTPAPVLDADFTKSEDALSKLVQNAEISNATVPNSSAAQNTVSDVQTPKTAAEAAKSKLGTPSGQTIAPKSGKWAFDRNALLTALSTAAAGTSYQERGNTVKKLDDEKAFANCASLAEATQVVIDRLATHQKATG